MLIYRPFFTPTFFDPQFFFCPREKKRKRRKKKREKRKEKRERERKKKKIEKKRERKNIRKIEANFFFSSDFDF